MIIISETNGFCGKECSKNNFPINWSPKSLDLGGKERNAQIQRFGLQPK